MKTRELTALEHYSQIDIAEPLRLVGYRSRAPIWSSVKSSEVSELRYLDDHTPRGSFTTEVFGTEKPRQKSCNVWERLGLTQPK